MQLMVVASHNKSLQPGHTLSSPREKPEASVFVTVPLGACVEGADIS